MVVEQIQKRGIADERVLVALSTVERHLFVPMGERDLSYGDFPLPIGYGQTISQPYIVACMSAALGLRENDRVLEIGTGSGYQAAVLSLLAKEVYSVELIPDLAIKAEQTLKDLAYINVHVRQGDGFAGWPEYAPFDAVIVTAAPAEIPERPLEQLKIGGRMILPLGTGSQDLYLITKAGGGIIQERLFPVRFVPMVKG